MKLCILNFDEITPDNDGGYNFYAPRASRARAAAACIGTILAGGKGKMSTSDHIREHQLSATIEERGDPGIPFDMSEVDIVRKIRTTLEEVVARYSKAHAKGSPVTPLPLDRAAKALNKIAWQASCEGGSLVVLPDSSVAWIVTCVDPAILLCGEPDLPRAHLVDNKLICGVRLVNPLQAQLDGLQKSMDVIITVNDEVAPEIQHSMGLCEAQNLWSGHNRLSCHVDIHNGKIPKVKGDIKISD